MRILSLYIAFLLCITLAGCTEDIPDPITHEAVLGMLKERPGGNSELPNGNSELPNGSSGYSQIVFVSESDFGMPQISLVNSDGTGFKSLGDGITKGVGYSPFWSPDGRVAFFSYIDFGFRVMNTDGTNSEVLASQELVEMSEFDPHFSWSKSGKIVFSVWDSVAGSSDIYSMDTSGFNLLRLTSSPAWSYSYYPDCSPDGTKVVFAFEDANGDTNIYTVESAGINIKQLTFTGEEMQPAWSPDGRKIAFTSDRDFDYEIYVMDADGTNQKNLTNNSDGDDERPTWSPDGTKIAFQSDRDFYYDIYIMDSDGTNQKNITNDQSADNVMPSWSPWLSTDSSDIIEITLTPL